METVRNLFLGALLGRSPFLTELERKRDRIASRDEMEKLIRIRDPSLTSHNIQKSKQSLSLYYTKAKFIFIMH